MNFKYYKTEQLIAFILGLFIVSDYLASHIDQWLSDKPVFEQINHVVHAFSSLSIIILVFIFIDRVGWKLGLFKWLIDIPNLNGRYEGELVSSYKDAAGNNEKKSCTLEIAQTASHIHISAYFADIGAATYSSASSSVSEELVKEKNDFFRLYYIFSSESEALQIQLNNHLGTARFSYFPDNRSLDGNYYNQRNNFGIIQVKFKSNKTLGRFK